MDVHAAAPSLLISIKMDVHAAAPSLLISINLDVHAAATSLLISIKMDVNAAAPSLLISINMDVHAAAPSLLISINMASPSDVSQKCAPYVIILLFPKSLFKYCHTHYGAIQVLRNAIFLEIGHPRNANNVEHYTFVTLFSRKSDPPTPICVT